MMLGSESETGNEDSSEELEELFKALGNVNRLILIYCLASDEKTEFSVTEMAKIMGCTQPAASQHLKVLKTVKISPQKNEETTYFTHLTRMPS